MCPGGWGKARCRSLGTAAGAQTSSFHTDDDKPPSVQGTAGMARRLTLASGFQAGVRARATGIHPRDRLQRGSAERPVQRADMGWMDGGHMAPTRKQHRGLHYKSIQCEPTSWPPDTGGVPIIPPSDACPIPKDPGGRQGKSLPVTHRDTGANLALIPRYGCVPRTWERTPGRFPTIHICRVTWRGLGLSFPKAVGRVDDSSVYRTSTGAGELLPFTASQ